MYFTRCEKRLSKLSPILYAKTDVRTAHTKISRIGNVKGEATSIAIFFFAAKTIKTMNAI
ncbi:hypothetical protein DSCA_64890 [Desulfosarcina alkanivorans]|uniref:Uncharacterized protein n=1 Tax=Desulfosarcina alkanivorans TaxID=571177 RepID=A0A5K7YWY7_9BACT|nr:hypothetical protein DSCA_64890 [Desulfosarcina alkanivorans]